MENLREGVQVIGYDYQYLYLNKTAITSSRYCREEIIGKKMEECYPGIEKTELFQKIVLCMEMRTSEIFENQFTFPDGSKEWYELHLSPVTEGVLILSLNVTERKRIEDALLQANKDRSEELLLNASKMSALGEMASGIAHEINNPLSIIVMQVQNMLRKFYNHELSDQSFEEGLQKIAGTAQRIGKVVKGLSAISRNSENDPKKVVSMLTIIEDTIQLSGERFHSHGIKLNLRLNLNENHKILCHPPQLMQVLLNLLNNAFDAVETLSEKWVEIHATADEKYIFIAVIDSGNGIPDQVLKKIMQPFYTTKEPGKGTGLGLSISKGIIEEHGGEIYYQKNSPHTMFVIKLPMHSSSS
jgi:PAS domain S-box-containing protein